jgi:hypothetical protein
MKARPNANSPQFCPQTTMATGGNQLNSLVEQMGSWPRHETLAKLSGESGAEVQAVCLLFVRPLSAHWLFAGTRNYSYYQLDAA